MIIKGPQWVWRFLKYINTWRSHRKVIKELNMLSDLELRDIGINRCDIDRLVWLEEDKEKRGNSK